MKQSIILGLYLIGFILCLGLVGCTNTTHGWKDYDVHSKLIAIEGENDLYYYSTTHIVYIVFNECGEGYTGFGYMSPYYSENGKLCKYDVKSKQLVEIDE